MNRLFFSKKYFFIEKNTSIGGTFTEFGGKFLPSLAEIVVKTSVIMSKKHEKQLLLIYNYLQSLLRRLAKNCYRVWRYFYRVWREIFTEFGEKCA